MSSCARKLTERLGGKWYGTYGAVRCILHEDHEPSLLLRDGDNVPLLVRCYAGCDPRQLLDELRRRGLLPSRGGERAAQADKRAEERRRADAARARQQREESARAIWRAARAGAGSPVESYLRSRGITLPVPASLRFHPTLRHQSGALLPAMVAAVQQHDRSIAGVHRTFLAPDGSGKADLAPAKMMLGAVGAGAVRLAAAGADLAIGEGIETCLSFAEATGIPSWAALSTAGLRGVALPPRPLAATVYVIVDADAPGERAARDAASRFAADGRKVKLAWPAAGKDINDALRAIRND